MRPTTRPTIFSLAVALALAGWSAALPAAEAQESADLGAQIEAALEEIRAKRGVPALGGAIVAKDGTLRGVAVVGVRALGSEPKATVDDLWHLGSCTKAMTATLAARLVERGLLKWDSTLAEALPERTMHESWQQVTLRQLLQHQGGAGAQWRPEVWRRAFDPKLSTAQCRELLVNDALTQPRALPVGTFAFSNMGYVLAGAMLETVADKPWEVLTREELWAPLGIKGGGFGPPGSTDTIDQPRPHAAGADGKLIPLVPGRQSDNPFGMGPAGTAHLSLADWGRFLAVHLRGNSGQEKPFLTAKAYKLLQTPPQGADYAAGWSVVTRGWARPPGAKDTPATVLTHSGSNTLNYATTWLAPQRGLGLLAVTNCGGQRATAATGDATTALLKLALQE